MYREPFKREVLFPHEHHSIVMYTNEKQHRKHHWLDFIDSVKINEENFFPAILTIFMPFNLTILYFISFFWLTQRVPSFFLLSVVLVRSEEKKQKIGVINCVCFCTNTAMNELKGKVDGRRNGKERNFSLNSHFECKLMFTLFYFISFYSLLLFWHSLAYAKQMNWCTHFDWLVCLKGESENGGSFLKRFGISVGFEVVLFGYFLEQKSWSCKKIVLWTQAFHIFRFLVLSSIKLHTWHRWRYQSNLTH